MYLLLSQWCFKHPWRGIAAWFLVLIAAAGLAHRLGDSYSGTLAIAGTESRHGADILEEHFGGVGAGPGGTVVFRAAQGVQDPEVRSAVGELLQQVDDIEGTTILSPYGLGGQSRIASEGTEAGKIAYADISLPPDTLAPEAQDVGAQIEDIIEELGLRSMDGLEIEVGGIWFAELKPPESEAIGLAFAIFVLIAVLGSVVATGVAIGAALVTVGIGAAGIVIFSNAMAVPDFALSLGLMIGLGVGIDYALFIITRYRAALSDGSPPEQAMTVALDSAGRSVVFAGATVVVSLLGMLFMGIPYITGFGIVVAATVAVVMAGSITLLPSILALLGDRVTTTRVRGIVAAAFVSVALFGAGVGFKPLAAVFLPAAAVVLLAGSFGGEANPLRRRLPPRRERALRETGWYKLSRTIQARPWAFAVGGTAVLILFAGPVLALRLGFADESNYGAETTTRKAYDLLVSGFGAGANGPILVVTETSDPADLTVLADLSKQLGGTEGVAYASPPLPSPTLGAAAIEVRPVSGPQSEKTDELVRTLRSHVILPAVEGSGLKPMVTGLVAVKADVNDFLKGRTAVFFAAVLGASFLLLTVVFRSLVVPLKAVIMNMLSISAAYGVLVAVFQWGWLGGIVGIVPGPIEPFMPMLLFAVLFGLSMDYEVFLLSRMKEEFERTGDSANSVADGLAATARVITAAALIMVFIFASFVLEDQRAIKMFGVGLAAAVAVDASLVRMLIVPSTMELLGARNWWLPSWLDRILPNVNVEGNSRRA